MLKFRKLENQNKKLFQAKKNEIQLLLKNIFFFFVNLINFIIFKIYLRSLDSKKQFNLIKNSLILFITLISFAILVA